MISRTTASSSELIPREQSGEIIRRLSTWQFGLGALAALGFWGLAAVIAIFALVQAFSFSAGFASPEVVAFFLLAGGLFVCGFLLLPSAGLALARLRGQAINPPSWLSLGRLHNLIFLLPLVVLLGYWISTLSNFVWLLLPPLHVAALGLPIIWLLWLGSRGLSKGSPQRLWGVFDAGLVIGSALILLFEILAAGLVFIVAVIFISSQPELIDELQGLAEQLRDLGPMPERMIQLLEPYFSRPPVLFTIFIFLAGLVPVIEEVLKPVGVWFLVRLNVTPAGGFVAGLFSGAGYAFFENLALSSQADSWALAVIARAGTGLLHMVTTGLFGWAIVLAWREGRYLRLVLTYLFAILLHGLWNGLSLFAFASFLELPGGSSLAVQTQGLAPILAPLGLGGLMLLAFGILIWANRALRPDRNAPSASPYQRAAPGMG